MSKRTASIKLKLQREKAAAKPATPAKKAVVAPAKKAAPAKKVEKKAPKKAVKTASSDKE